MGQPHKLYDVVIKNDMRSLAEWTADNPVLQRGAFGVESDSFMYKIGDGEHTWNELPYAGVKGITKLSTPRRLRLLGGATGETYFDGSADIDIDVTVNGIEHTHNAREIIGLKDRITTLFGFYRLADYFYIQDACLYLDTKLFLSDEEREKINSSFSYTHPSAGPAEAVTTKGVYRITVDTDGHTNTVDKATLADIADTSYYVKFTAAERTKLQTVEVGANKYIHPEDGVYPMMLSTELKKVRVDTYGHVLDVEDASLDDIFDSQTYVRMTATERERLAAMEDNANKYELPRAQEAVFGGVLLAKVDDLTNLDSEDIGFKAITVPVLNSVVSDTKTEVEDVRSKLNTKVAIAMPIGTVIMFAANDAPEGDCWLYCNGAEVSREVFSELFAVIGTAWGDGDGSTTFNLPSGGEADEEGTGDNQRFVGLAMNSVGYADAGLPDITGKTGCTVGGGWEGAFTQYTGSFRVGHTDYWGCFYATFAASSSNVIYGNSTTVRPKAMFLKPWIKAKN